MLHPESNVIFPNLQTVKKYMIKKLAHLVEGKLCTNELKIWMVKTWIRYGNSASRRLTKLTKGCGYHTSFEICEYRIFK